MFGNIIRGRERERGRETVLLNNYTICVSGVSVAETTTHRRLCVSSSSVIMGFRCARAHVNFPKGFVCRANVQLMGLFAMLIDVV